MGYFFFPPFLSGAWLRADPATRFTAAGVFGLLSSFAAVVATFGLVFSFFAMTHLLGFTRAEATTKAFEGKDF